MTELNNIKPLNIEILSYNTVLIGDTSNYSDYISGGIMIEAKTKKEMNFICLNERFEIPYKENEDIPEQIDYSKINTNEIIHIGILALNQFYSEKNKLPEINIKEHSKIIIDYGKEIYEKKREKIWLG